MSNIIKRITSDIAKNTKALAKSGAREADEILGPLPTRFKKPKADDIIDVEALPDKSNTNWLKSLGIIGGTGAITAGMMSGGDDQPPMTPMNAQAPIPTPEPKAPVAALPAEETPLAALQKQLKPVGSPVPQASREPADKSLNIDLGEQSDHMAELKAAQGKRDSGVLANQLGKSAEIIGSAISGAKPVAQGIFDQNMKLAGQDVESFKEKMEAQKYDKNSPVSKAFKEYAKKLGVNITGDMSAADAEKIMPYIAKGFEAEENRKSRELTAQLARETMADNRAERRHQREETTSAKRSEKLEKYTFDARKEITSGGFAKQYANVNNAQKASGAITQFAKNPTGYSDYGTLMTSLKALQGDDSVVREAEIRLGMQAGSLFQSIQNTLQRAQNGQSLQPSQRDAILKAVNTLNDVSTSQYLSAIEPVLEQADELGLNRDHILPGNLRSAQKQKSEKQKASTEDKTPQSKQTDTPKSTERTVVKRGYNAKTNQTQLIYSDGSKEIIDGQQ